MAKIDPKYYQTRLENLVDVTLNLNSSTPNTLETLLKNQKVRTTEYLKEKGLNEDQIKRFKDFEALCIKQVSEILQPKKTLNPLGLNGHNAELNKNPVLPAIKQENPLQENVANNMPGNAGTNKRTGGTIIT